MTPMRIGPKLGKQGMAEMEKMRCERTVRIVYKRRLVHCTANGGERERRREEATVMQIFFPFSLVFALILDTGETSRASLRTT